ncbi:MAG: PilZ domain-containing protein [Phycisphaerales bacterium]
MTNWQALEVLERVQRIKDNDRRTSPRLACGGTTCGGGTVMDLSRTGMRVRTKSKPPRGDGAIGLELTGPKGTVRVGGRPVWSRKAGRGVYEIGFAFEQAA